MSDRSVLKQLHAASFQSNPTSVIADPVGEVNKMHRRTYTWVKAAADTNATDNTAEFNIVNLQVATKVIAASYTPIANVASAANNTIQLTVSARLAADPANAVVVCNALTNATAMTAWTPYAVTLVATAASVTANSVLTFKVLKANSGTALGAGVLSVTVEEV